MAIKWNGSSVLWDSGNLAMHNDCCCEEVPLCCEGYEDDVTLYLTLSEFAIDPGSFCDANCTTPWELIAEPSDAAGPRSGAVWTINCEDTDGRMLGTFALGCNGSGVYSFADVFLTAPKIVDQCGFPITTYCYIYVSTPLGEPSSCDPFLIDVTIPVSMQNTVGGAVCATGTLRVTITE